MPRHVCRIQKGPERFAGTFDRLRNDLHCVVRDVKLYTHSIARSLADMLQFSEKCSERTGCRACFVREKLSDCVVLNGESVSLGVAALASVLSSPLLAASSADICDKRRTPKSK